MLSNCLKLAAIAALSAITLRVLQGYLPAIEVNTGEPPANPVETGETVEHPDPNVQNIRQKLSTGQGLMAEMCQRFTTFVHADNIERGQPLATPEELQKAMVIVSLTSGLLVEAVVKDAQMTPIPNETLAKLFERLAERDGESE